MESKIRMESALTKDVKYCINVYELGMKREMSEMEKDINGRRKEG